LLHPRAAWFQPRLEVEEEDGAHDPGPNTTDDDEIPTGEIALARLGGYPDYYTRLARMEGEARKSRSGRR